MEYEKSKMAAIRCLSIGTVIFVSYSTACLGGINSLLLFFESIKKMERFHTFFQFSHWTDQESVTFGRQIAIPLSFSFNDLLVIANNSITLEAHFGL